MSRKAEESERKAAKRDQNESGLERNLCIFCFSNFADGRSLLPQGSQYFLSHKNFV